MIDQTLRESPETIRMMEIMIHDADGVQMNGLPDAHHINAGIPATKTRNPRQ